MTRKQIQLEKGAILPSAHGLWESASTKLQEAEKAISEMKLAHDRISFEEGWSHFVDSIEQFWTRFFDEGKEKFTSFAPWAGAINHKRRKDETLSYITQSRNKSQHGRISMTWDPTKLIMGRGFAGLEYGLQIFPDGSYQETSAPESPNSRSFTVEYSPGDAKLPSIENLHKMLYLPPTIFLGEPLKDKSPVGVADSVLSHYQSILKSAYEKFAKNNHQ